MGERVRRPAADQYRRPHVLVVTDDTGLSGFLNEGLVIAGCWVSVIASGLQTLEVFRLRTFEAMVVDVALGGLGASELIRRLRLVDESTGRPRTDIPILLVAEREAEVAASGVDPAQIDATLLAPLEVDELALRIYDVVRRWRAAHSDRPWSDDLAQSRDDG